MGVDNPLQEHQERGIRHKRHLFHLQASTVSRIHIGCRRLAFGLADPPNSYILSSPNIQVRQGMQERRRRDGKGPRLYQLQEKSSLSHLNSGGSVYLWIVYNEMDEIVNKRNYRNSISLLDFSK